MDMEKFIEAILNRKELKNIPIEYVVMVVCSVFDILNNENVFYAEYVKRRRAETRTSLRGKFGVKILCFYGIFILLENILSKIKLPESVDFRGVSLI